METLKLYYQTSDGNPVDNITMNGETLESVGSNGFYSVSVPDISSLDLNTVYTIDFDGYKVKISPMSYVYSVLKTYEGDESQKALVDLCKAVYKYAEAADTYFGSAG